MSESLANQAFKTALRSLKIEIKVSSRHEVEGAYEQHYRELIMNCCNLEDLVRMIENDISVWAQAYTDTDVMNELKGFVPHGGCFPPLPTNREKLPTNQEKELSKGCQSPVLKRLFDQEERCPDPVPQQLDQDASRKRTRLEDCWYPINEQSESTENLPNTHLKRQKVISSSDYSGFSPISSDDSSSDDEESSSDGFSSSDDEESDYIPDVILDEFMEDIKILQKLTGSTQLKMHDDSGEDISDQSDSRLIDWSPEQREQFYKSLIGLPWEQAESHCHKYGMTLFPADEATLNVTGKRILVDTNAESGIIENISRIA